MRMLTTYIPTRGFTSDIWSEMDRFLDDWNRSVANKSYSERSFSPASEITESGDYYLMSLDLPGMKQDDIKIEMSDDILTISGERKRATSEKSYGYFKRSFSLPEAVEADKIEARYENGVLELYLPKTPAAKPRHIQIQSGKASFFDKLLGSKKTNQELKDVTASKVS